MTETMVLVESMWVMLLITVPIVVVTLIVAVAVLLEVRSGKEVE